jgi:uncharacterized membrane protein YccC
MFTAYVMNPTAIYIFEFLSASAIAYALLILYPEHRMVWAMTSIALVLTPKSDGSKSLINDRIRANILGAMVGFLIMIIREPTIYLFCLGTVLTIVISKYLNIYRTVRSSLVALVIIMIPVYHDPRATVAMERLFCVIIGCVIALLITLLFDFILSKTSQPAPTGFARGKPDADDA